MLSYNGFLLSPQILDTDNNVRYYACESLYNVVKVCKDAIMPSFLDLFVCLALVYGDSEQNIRHGAEQLDRSLKVRKNII
jgi:vacuole morphology and inheritance protein 14